MASASLIIIRAFTKISMAMIIGKDDDYVGALVRPSERRAIQKLKRKGYGPKPARRL
jgi:hypothetical protein